MSRDGAITDVQWDGPAFRQGITDGSRIQAVNGESFDVDRLERAVTGAKGTGTAIELLVRNGERYRTVRFDYHDGLRYPHLERQAAARARLDDILTPRR